MTVGLSFKREYVIPLALILASAYLLWDGFLKPNVGFSGWQISNDDKYWAETSLPHHTYHTIIPYLYFRGNVYIPKVVDYPQIGVSFDGCINEVYFNDFLVYSNSNCTSHVQHDERSIDVSGVVKSGENEMKLKMMFDGGTTRFELENPRKHNLLRFTLAALLLLVSSYLITKEKRVVFIVVFTCFILIHVMEGYFPVSWGFDALRYYPLHIKLMLVLLSVLFLIPQTFQHLEKYLITAYNRIKNTQANLSDTISWHMSKYSYHIPQLIRSEFGYLLSYAKILLVMAASFIFFWVFRTKKSMGDAGFVGQIAVNKIYLFFNASPLGAWMLTFTYRLLQSIGFNYSSYDAAAILACLLGAVFVPILWLISKELTEDRWRRYTIFSVAFTSYFMQLFYGYIEFYPTLLFGMTVYIYASLLYLKDKCSIVYPSLSFGILFCTNLSSAYLAPSLLVLILLKKRSTGIDVTPEFFKMAAAAAIPVVLILGHVIFVFGECPNTTRICVMTFIHSLRGNDIESMKEFLTLNTLEDAINEHILIAPAGFLFLLFAIAFHKIKVDDVSVFLAAVTILFFIYMAVQTAGLDFPQNWGAFAPAGLLYTLLGAYLVVGLTEDNKTLRYYVTSSLAVVILIHTMPFILQNADEKDLLLDPIQFSVKGIGEVKSFYRTLVGVYQGGVGGDLIDSIDIGNPLSERAHDYRISSELSNGTATMGYEDGRVVADSYRIHSDYESFVVDSVPLRDLVVVSRMACPSNESVRVYLHGIPVGVLKPKCRGLSAFWVDETILASGMHIQGDKVNLMMVSENKGEILSSYYWFYLK